MATVALDYKGSSKSGNYGHAGRRGKVGGSAPKAAVIDVPQVNYRTMADGREALAWGKNQNVGLVKTITDAEKWAIASYTDGTDEVVNTYLRGGERNVGWKGQPKYTADYETGDSDKSRPLSTLVADLDNVMKRSTVPEDVTVFRVAKFPDDVVKSMKPGSVFSDNGFVSTTLTSKQANIFAKRVQANTHMEIGVPQGAHAVFTGSKVGGAYQSEAELLLARGAKFKIVSNDGQGNIRMELII